MFDVRIDEQRELVIRSVQDEYQRSRYLYYLDQVWRIKTLINEGQSFEAGIKYCELVQSFKADTEIPSCDFKCGFRSFIHDTFRHD